MQSRKERIATRYMQTERATLMKKEQKQVAFYRREEEVRERAVPTIEFFL